jgi:arylsulfatase A-like enzyme
MGKQLMITFGNPLTRTERVPDRPNILLICVDQWRRDALGIAGHPVVETPYLDELALRGVRFTRAYSATPTCIPARAALLTGLNATHNGRPGYTDAVPWNYPVTIASEFTHHGYQTEAIGKLHVYPERSQMGFQHVVLHDGFLHVERRRDRSVEQLDDYLPWLRRELGHDVDYFDHGINVNGVTVRPWDKPEYTHPSTWVVSQAVDFLRRRDTRKPFFLYLGFHRPHPPYDPPEWAYEQYSRQEMPECPVGDWVDTTEPFRQDTLHNAYTARYGKKRIDRARAGYFGHLTHIDHQLNRLFEHLKEYGQHENTWICFVSDHGEMMGDHHLYRKGYAYEGSAGVPLILTGPAPGDLPAGLTRDAVVELRDIMPTLLDCAGLPAPDGIDGKSLLPVARGEAESVRPYLHGEHPIFGQSMQWVTDGHEKYIWWSETGTEQLFDLDHDPEELRDLARNPACADRLAQWRTVLIRELAGREDGFSDGGHLVTGQPPMRMLPSVLAQFAERARASP